MICVVCLEFQAGIYGGADMGRRDCSDRRDVSGRRESSRRIFANRKILSASVATLALVSFNISANAPDCPGALQAFGRKQKQPPALPEDTVELINKLATQPELMNVQYLRWVIGSPENERSQFAMKSKNFFWYNPLGHRCMYELHQDGPALGVNTVCSFTLHLIKSQVTTKEMEKVFGGDHKRVFDRQAYPVDVYQTGPYTRIACTQPHNSFRVEKIQVLYDGPPLSPPSKQEILNAYNAGKEKALALADANDDPRVAIPWLEREVRYHPQDANLHLQLAQAYRSNLMLPEAINEYGTAARLAGNDRNVVSACRTALIEMKVFPPPGKEPAAATQRNGQQRGGRGYLVQGENGAEL